MSEGPLLHRCISAVKEVTRVSAVSARSTREAEGLDKVRALQWVLYRSAKSDPARRFHALYGHLARTREPPGSMVFASPTSRLPG